MHTLHVNSKPIEVINHQKQLTRFYNTMGDISDGYHSFNELYEFRKLYNAALFNLLAKHDAIFKPRYNVHKSWKHSDGEECFGGDWFIVIAYLDRKQVSNHYKAADWGLFDVPEQETADEWDGHTAQDVVARLKAFIEAQL